MKTAKLDRLGRVVIPIQHRKNLGAFEGTLLNIEYADGKVIISLAEEHCRMCGKVISHSLNVPLCRTCIEKIKTLKIDT